MCWPVVVKAPSNEKAQMTEILMVFILLSTENKICMCLAYFSSLKVNKLWALHIHEFSMFKIFFNRIQFALFFMNTCIGRRIFWLKEYKHSFFILNIVSDLITFNLLSLLWIPRKGFCVIELGYRSEWQYWKFYP